MANTRKRGPTNNVSSEATSQKRAKVDAQTSSPELTVEQDRSLVSERAQDEVPQSPDSGTLSSPPSTVGTSLESDATLGRKDLSTNKTEHEPTQAQPDQMSASHAKACPEESQAQEASPIIGTTVSAPDALALLPMTPASNPTSPRQFPTPPESVPAKRTKSGRASKPVQRFGDVVDTSSIVPKGQDPGSDPFSDQQEKQDTDFAIGTKTAKQKASSRRTKKAASTSAHERTPDVGTRVTKPQKKARATKKSMATTTVSKTSGTIKLSIKKSPNRRNALQIAKKPSSRGVAGTKAIRKQRNTQAQTMTDAAPPTRLLPVDPNLLVISRKLTKRAPLKSKPQPQGQPRVWADSRQALSETLPYFKRPQGGCYTNNNHAYAFLFDSAGHPREYTDENVIICRAGGSMITDGQGNMVQRQSHSRTEFQVRAVLNDNAYRNPLIVIFGDCNVQARSEMPHKYCVLDWYKPVAVWEEKTAGKGGQVFITVKYRFERLNHHKPAWHAPKDSLLTAEEAKQVGEPLQACCAHCHDSYPRVYLQGWMCLNSECAAFWKIDGVDAPYGKEGLDYDPAFLKPSSELWKADYQDEEPEPPGLVPPIPTSGDEIGDNLGKVFSRGIVCPKCGRCNSRRFFKAWICENDACDFRYTPTHKLVTPPMLRNPWDTSNTLVRNDHESGVSLQVTDSSGHKVIKYTFDNFKGSFTHIRPYGPILEEEAGPNEMFAALQTEDLGLQRRVFGVENMSGGKAGKGRSKGTSVATDKPTASMLEPEEVDAGDDLPESDVLAEDKDEKETFAPGDLMGAFSMNYGVPYKFVATGASKPFEDAPWPITECRRRLNWAQRTFLDEDDGQEACQDFNEELIFAYLDGQKIKYHDDGEKGLGPRIATLSLGGRAKMSLRIKSKYFVGCSKNDGLFTDERPIRGGIEGPEMDDRKLEKWTQLQELKGDSTQYKKRRREIAKELGIFSKKSSHAPELLSVTLNHGDIILMGGPDIQKYLEHSVVPEDRLRFALTCRTMLEDHLKPEERPSYSVEVDPVKYAGPQFLRGSGTNSGSKSLY